MRSPIPLAPQAASDDQILRDVLRDVDVIRNKTETLANDVNVNTAAVLKERGQCKNEMLDRLVAMTELVSTATQEKLAETLHEYQQIYHEYEPCSIGKVYQKLLSHVKGDQTCLGKNFRAGDLHVPVTLTSGKPEITLECQTAACYQCLAELGCGIDTFLSAITDQKLVKEGLIVPAKNYLGNHQVRFDGKLNELQLPRFFEASDEFTFEAWVAWEPEYSFPKKTATARIFDFFAKKNQRGEDRKGTNGESAALLDQAEMLLSQDDGTVDMIEMGERTNFGHEEERPGNYELKFKPAGEDSAQWVSGFSLSPGQHVPQNETSLPEYKDKVGVQFNIDSIQLTGKEPLSHKRWQHVAVTVDKIGAVKERDCCWNIRLYVDGKVVASQENIPLYRLHLDRILYAVDSNFLGRSQSGAPDSRFKGYMDEVRIWRASRTPKEIYDFMHIPVDPADKGLIAYYRFDELLNAEHMLDQTANKHDMIVDVKNHPEHVPKRLSIRPEFLPAMSA